METMNLYVVSTPIGNLEDITLRAIRVLKEVDLILCEDTRTSRVLLNHYEIKTPTTSFHSYSTSAKADAIVRELKSGKQMALISDAGTPGISDPAYTLIQTALAEGINIIPIPGASAVLAALVASGLPMDKFLYLGFVPAKKGRATLFESIKDEQRTIVLYESPHRILKTLGQMKEILGDNRTIVVARELTKLHETFHRGTLAQIYADFTTHPPKGEMVILVGPKDFA
ncbi:MAG: 16S rRNA (cytidine(1402)-2'-O)-methyltransferase [Parcubacteria group bacterium]|nr:16S rRNA (cytidine(1402)-2'-O)-methyltransferase [Parcubacteria group bacterium]